MAFSASPASKKWVYATVAVVGMAVAGGVAWWRQSQPQGPKEIGVKPSGAAPGQGAPAAGGPAGPARPAGVEVAKVEPTRMQDDAQAVGTLRSRQNVMLRPEVAGRIKALGFADGTRVRKGQMLVQLDDTLQRAELKQAQAQLSIARANHKRNQELVAENFLAKRTSDESAATLQVAEAQVALVQARLQRMRVVAPFDGVAGLRNVNVGDYVRDGADMVNVEDLSTMFVDLRLPERFQGKLQTGQTVALQLDALPGQTFNAKVQAIDPLLDAAGRSLLVRAAVQNSGHALLRPGMSARAQVVFGVNDNALVVPEEAIVPQGGKQYVIRVVAPSELPGGAPAGLPPDVKTVSLRQEVKLGVRRAGKVQIAEGVSAGQTVVVAGQQRLQKDGTPVRIVDMGAPAGEAKGKPPAAAPSPSASPAAPAAPASGR